MRVLLVEDEPVLGDAVRTHLRRQGHAVDWVQRLDDARAALDGAVYGVMLLDLHLPDGRGLDFLKEMRARNDLTPTLIVTSRDQIRDRIEGLDTGADDYVVKPFDLHELSARIGAVSRRSAVRSSSAVRVGDVSVDHSARCVVRDGQAVELSAKEWAVLECLLQNPGAIFSKSHIENILYPYGEEVESDAVEVYVSRIRRKIGSNGIRTVRGLGYRVEAKP